MTNLRFEIKSFWRRHTDHGPRLHLQWPLAIKPSRAQCHTGFYKSLFDFVNRTEKVEGYTNGQLASALEFEAVEHVPIFSVLDSLTGEAVRRLRGPGTPAAGPVTPLIEDPVAATRRGEP